MLKFQMTVNNNIKKTLPNPCVWSFTLLTPPLALSWDFWWAKTNHENCREDGKRKLEEGPNVDLKLLYERLACPKSENTEKNSGQWRAWTIGKGSQNMCELKGYLQRWMKEERSTHSWLGSEGNGAKGEKGRVLWEKEGSPSLSQLLPNKHKTGKSI